MTPLMIALVLATAVAALTFVVGSVTAERAEVRDSLRRLEGYQIQDVRDQEMLAPIGERVFTPLLESLTGIARRFTPAGFGEGIANKLVLAGSPANLNVDKVLVMKLLGIVSVIVWAPLVLALHFQGLMALVAIALLWGASFLYPDVVLNRKIADRQKEISRKLPDILDLLVISVEAGLGFEQALDRTCTAVPGALSDEFRRMLHEIRIGSSRADRAPRHGRAHLGTGAPGVHPRDAPSRHLRRVDLPAAPCTSRRDAHPAPSQGSGGSAEGTGQDAVPVGVLHLPVDLRRDHRARLHPDLALSLRR